MAEERPVIIGAKLLHRGFIYNRSRLGTQGKQYWDCQKLRTKECRARAISSGYGDHVVLTQDPVHDHPPDRELAEAERVKFQLKEEAKNNPAKGPTQILRDVMRNVPDGVVAHLPDRPSLKKSMRHARRGNLPPNPRNLAELGALPEKFQQTLSGDRFLLWDSAEEGNLQGRVLVFGTRRNIELLAGSEVWYLDGTFKVSFFVTIFCNRKSHKSSFIIRCHQRFSRKFSQSWARCTNELGIVLLLYLWFTPY